MSERPRYLVVGYGSIGRRHALLIRKLRPAAEIVVVDPECPELEPDGVWNWFHRDLGRALETFDAVAGAVVASPFSFHVEQAQRLTAYGLPFMLEKPPAALGQIKALRDLERVVAHARLPHAVGFCYRYHKSFSPAAVERLRDARLFVVTAQDDLIGRYGPTVAETMATHAIDLALWILGPTLTRAVADAQGGTVFSAQFRHSGGTSAYSIRIDRGPRMFTVNHDKDVPADDDMYERQMAAWLAMLETGHRDERLATLADGVAVMQTLER